MSHESGRFTFTGLALSSLALVSCGGGGGDNSQTVTAPSTSTSQVNAGPDIAITLPDTRARLAGSASGDKLVWEQVSGPTAVTFQSADRAVTQVAARTPGTYVLRLSRESSASGGAASDTMTLTVNPNPVTIGATSTPLDHLRSEIRPVFKTGHTLLPLTYSSCAVSGNVQVEMMQNWGYAGQFTEGVNLTNSPVLQEIRNRPGTYPVAYSQASLWPIFNNYRGTNAQRFQPPPETYIRDAAGNIVIENGRPIVSPIAPDSVFTQIGQQIGDKARAVEEATGQPIRIVVNEGEYGLWLAGEENPSRLWGQDPAVMAAYNASGQSSWFAFVSIAKARQERLIKEGIFSRLARGRPTYSWYLEAFGPERGRWFGWQRYMFIWEHFLSPDRVPQVSDYSSPQMYFNDFNTGWTGIQSQQGIPYDALTQALRDVGGAISLGQRFVYPWVSLGWERGSATRISDDDLFLGMMKAYFTAGAIGAVSGYFTCEGAPFEAMRSNLAVGTTRPVQIRNVIQLSKAYALFTHLEPFLRDGDLLPGPNDHPYSAAGSGVTKAMEFPAVGETAQVPWGTRTATVPTARVLARKMRNADRWLVTAWANTGSDRNIRVTIDPRLGELTLNARRAGSVYIVELVNGTVRTTQMDPNPDDPTATLFS